MNNKESRKQNEIKELYFQKTVYFDVVISYINITETTNLIQSYEKKTYGQDYQRSAPKDNFLFRKSK